MPDVNPSTKALAFAQFRQTDGIPTPNPINTIDTLPQPTHTHTATGSTQRPTTNTSEHPPRCRHINYPHNARHPRERGDPESTKHALPQRENVAKQPWFLHTPAAHRRYACVWDDFTVVPDVQRGDDSDRPCLRRHQNVKDSHDLRERGAHVQRRRRPGPNYVSI